jgi:organic radical activating enzyme
MELPVRTDGKLLDVHSVFGTIQGEGPFAGMPAVFCRLAGCNLQCSGCDTDYTTGRGGMSVEDIVRTVCNQPIKTDLVVLTGGEPFRQNVAPLVDLLLGKDYRVQLETNGTLYLDPFPWGNLGVTVVCSPKANVNVRVRPWVKHLKYVLDAREVHPNNGLPTKVLGTYIPQHPWPDFRGTVWVSPADVGDPEQNKRNAEACVRSAMRYGYRVSVQTHKLLGVP